MRIRITRLPAPGEFEEYDLRHLIVGQEFEASSRLGMLLLWMVVAVVRQRRRRRAQVSGDRMTQAEIDGWRAWLDMKRRAQVSGDRMTWAEIDTDSIEKEIRQHQDRSRQLLDGDRRLSELSAEIKTLEAEIRALLDEVTE